MGVIYDSQPINRSAQGGGVLAGSPPSFLLVASRTARHFFTAIQKRVKGEIATKIGLNCARPDHLRAELLKGLSV